VLARHPPLNSSYNPFTQVNRIGTHAIQYTKLGSLFLPDAVGSVHVYAVTVTVELVGVPLRYKDFL